MDRCCGGGWGTAIGAEGASSKSPNSSSSSSAADGGACGGSCCATGANGSHDSRSWLIVACVRSCELCTGGGSKINSSG